MKKYLLFIFLTFALVPATGVRAQSDYANDLAAAATPLITSFTANQKRSALLTMEDTARLKWNNLPFGLRARAGVSIGNMTEQQRKLLHRLLSVALSSQGYLKASGILHLDNLINMYVDTAYARGEINADLRKVLADLKWSHRNYFFAVFGQPGDKAWGFKLEGHHLSVNLTCIGNTVAVTPWFIGTDPAEMPNTEYAGWRVLGQEEDLGIALINSLSVQQQQKATLSKEVPEDIITGAETGRRLIEYWGLPAKEMNRQQQELLDRIIREFVFNMEWPKAIAEYEKIKNAGLEQVYFGWIGPYDEYKAHYFVLNGPTFLIEFDNAGGPRRKGNHIHAIWREKGNEFGEDMLKNHYLNEKH